MLLKTFKKMRDFGGQFMWGESLEPVDQGGE